MKESEQKKRTWLWDVLVIIGGLLGCYGLMLVLRKAGMVVVAMLFAALMLYASGDMDELLFTTSSPGGTHTLHVYRVNPGATEPFYIRADEVGPGKPRTVYNVRGQSEAEVIWLSEDEAEINGVPVDVTGGDCFKANARGYFDVNVQVKAEDVRWLEVTVCMDGEPRLVRSRAGMEMVDEVDAWGLSNRLNVLRELQWDDDLTKKKAGLMITVETASGERITLPYLWEWFAKEYGDYTFTLTGSAQSGYSLTTTDADCFPVPVQNVKYLPAH